MNLYDSFREENSKLSRTTFLDTVYNKSIYFSMLCWLVVLPPIYVADTKIIFRYNFVAP